MPLPDPTGVRGAPQRPRRGATGWQFAALARCFAAFGPVSPMTRAFRADEPTGRIVGVVRGAALKQEMDGFRQVRRVARSRRSPASVTTEERRSKTASAFGCFRLLPGSATVRPPGPETVRRTARVTQGGLRAPARGTFLPRRCAVERRSARSLGRCVCESVLAPRGQVPGMHEIRTSHLDRSGRQRA